MGAEHAMCTILEVAIGGCPIFRLHEQILEAARPLRRRMRRLIPRKCFCKLALDNWWFGFPRRRRGSRAQQLGEVVTYSIIVRINTEEQLVYRGVGLRRRSRVSNRGALGPRIA
jgi:hypothetical protein